MCIIKIFKEGEISSKELDDLWEQNPHGAGIGLIDNCLSLKVPLRTFDKEEFKTVLTRYLQSVSKLAIIQFCRAIVYCRDKCSEKSENH